MSRPRSPLFPIFLVVLVDVFGFSLVIPLLAIYAEHFAASPMEATLLVSVFAACQLVSGPILGQISDRVGRKPVLIVSQIGTLIGFIVMARAHALWVLYLARIIDGATAGNLSIAQAYISDNTTPENRSKSFAIIGIAFGVGFFIGPFVTGYLMRYGITAPVWAAAVLSATSILATVTLLPSGVHPSARPPQTEAAPGGKRVSIFAIDTYAQYLKRPIVGGLLVQFFFYIFCFSTFISGFALFAERTYSWHGVPFSPREIGYLFAYSGFLGIILQGGLMGRIVKRFGEPALVVAGFVTLIGGYTVLGLVRTLPALIVVTTVSSFGVGVVRPVLSSMLTQQAGRHEQGTVLGIAQSLNSVAQILAPALGGYLIGAGHTATWALVAAGAAAIGLVLVRVGSGRVPPRPPSVENARPGSENKSTA